MSFNSLFVSLHLDGDSSPYNAAEEPVGARENPSVNVVIAENRMNQSVSLRLQSETYITHYYFGGSSSKVHLKFKYQTV